MNNALVQDESLHLARNLLQNKHLSQKVRIERAYLSVFQREPTAAEVKRASKFIKDETRLLASQKPEEIVPRTSTPEPAPPVSQPVRPEVAMGAVTPAAAATNSTAAVATPATTVVAINATTNTPAPPDTGGGGRAGRGGFRFPRTFNGPGSASDVVVGKLAPGIARPKVFRQALPEKPANPEEGALALFNQALFGSAEFRYLQ